ncbi:hypothetical protein NSK_001812 [Nannochloropsis salina CCMP1776]|uniref:Glycosyl hydrolase family 31 C-terminal domain-containing protein n=1 Tax=Nannochloropsis salina CCMP1776 TaxID=1027361 RepID=A0A4D9D6S6_9STRA|nr:hypothetical protein NSK_001812 [Nannochloropsis salina CCMP1776]|eukprot:TFJ86724.1 hypothetical protein NSK_001812 [Nannochloropsis salina CCMP1776]
MSSSSAVPCISTTHRNLAIGACPLDRRKQQRLRGQGQLRRLSALFYTSFFAFVCLRTANADSPTSLSIDSNDATDVGHGGIQQEIQTFTLAPSLTVRVGLNPFILEVEKTLPPPLPPLLLRSIQAPRPGSPPAYADSQFLLGDSLLVAPVLQPHHRRQTLYLPRGPSGQDNGTRPSSVPPSLPPSLTWVDVSSSLQYDEDDGRFRLGGGGSWLEGGQVGGGGEKEEGGRKEGGGREGGPRGSEERDRAWWFPVSLGLFCPLWLGVLPPSLVTPPPRLSCLPSAPCSLPPVGHCGRRIRL